MGPRIGIPLSLAALLAAQGSGAAQGSDERPPIAPSIYQSLESAAHQLAKGGKRGETNEVADLLAALGQPRNANEKLRAALAQELAKAPAAPPKGPPPRRRARLRSVVPRSPRF